MMRSLRSTKLSEPGSTLDAHELLSLLLLLELLHDELDDDELEHDEDEDELLEHELILKSHFFLQHLPIG